MTAFSSFIRTRIPLLLLLALAACTPSAEEADSFASEHPVSELPPVAGPDTSTARTPVNLSRGQVLYLPIYSHIYFRTQERTINLAATVSIRNTDPNRPIVLSTIDYIDNNGTRVRRYLKQPRRLAPMASTSLLIEESDAAGGLGANFLITWRAEQPVNAPIVESIMISTRSSLGISFTSRAQVLSER
ncbi:MAG: DUF3124 domain-containing protein [Bacteroidetes bacterium]|jgi:hypothetical protein|nr:DUF3124 domain-containing protein [Bacteroidota bacterium]